MKKLFINRHAKSSWADNTMRDFDRPLNNRGMRDAPFMAKVLKNRSENIDTLVTSPANRALSTARFFAAELDFSEDQIVRERGVYGASSTELADIVTTFDNKWESVIMFGHNPGFSNLVEYFTGEFVEMPTCGIAAVTFEIDHWKEAFRENGTLDFLDFPKNHEELKK